MKNHKVATWKPKVVEELAGLIDRYPTVAIIDMQNLPSKHLQLIRAKIKDKALIKMTRKRLLKRAIETCQKSSAKDLIEYVTGMPAIMFSEANAFELFDTIKQNMSDAPAKAGQEAPFDIIVPAGPTPFAPGPIISQLGAAKIKASIQAGKIVVINDSTVAKQGEKISEIVASILDRLGIHPMKIGINLSAILEKDDIYTKSVLDIDKEKYIEDLLFAHQNAYKLALGLGILTAETVIPQLQKAHLEAKQLAVSQSILADEVKEQILAKVEGQVKQLKEAMPEPEVPSTSGSEASQGLPEVKIEEKPVEVKEEKKETESEKKEVEEKPIAEVKPEVKDKIKKKKEKPKEKPVKKSKSPKSKEEPKEGKSQEVK